MHNLSWIENFGKKKSPLPRLMQLHELIPFWNFFFLWPIRPDQRLSSLTPGAPSGPLKMFLFENCSLCSEEKVPKGCAGKRGRPMVNPPADYKRLATRCRLLDVVSSCDCRRRWLGQNATRVAPNPQRTGGRINALKHPLEWLLQCTDKFNSVRLGDLRVNFIHRRLAAVWKKTRNQLIWPAVSGRSNLNFGLNRSSLNSACLKVLVE